MSKSELKRKNIQKGKPTMEGVEDRLKDALFDYPEQRQINYYPVNETNDHFDRMRLIISRQSKLIATLVGMLAADEPLEYCPDAAEQVIAQRTDK